MLMKGQRLSFFRRKFRMVGSFSLSNMLISFLLQSQNHLRAKAFPTSPNLSLRIYHLDFWWLIHNRFQLYLKWKLLIFVEQFSWKTEVKFLVLNFLQLRQSVETTSKIQLKFKKFQICHFFLIVLTKTKVNHFWQKLIRNVQPKNSYQLFSCTYFLESWHFSKIIFLLMFIQFSDGVLQLKFVSGKQENG
jgi:hypothetical protein